MKVRLISVFLLFIVCFSHTSVFEVAAAFSAPQVSAHSAVLLECETGEIYFSKNADEKLPMASTTKIMTALVALENSDPSDTVIIDRRAVGVEGSSVYLLEGELLTMENLLYALLLASANDAAAAIAYEISGSIEDFAALMNEKAARIGLTDTHFENPHGLDSDEHYTTAKDLALLSAEALKNESFKKIVSTYKTTIPMDGGTRVLINHNKLLRSYDGAIGVKTGFTKRSGRCLVSAAERDGLTLVAVTINAPNDWKDHASMLDAGFAAYKKVKPLEAKSQSFAIPVIGGKESTIMCTNAGDISAILPSDVSEESITFSFECPRFLYAPVKNGEVVGSVICYADGEMIGKSDIVTCFDIEAVRPKRNLIQKIFDFFAGLFS